MRDTFHPEEFLEVTRCQVINGLRLVWGDELYERVGGWSEGGDEIGWLDIYVNEFVQKVTTLAQCRAA